ncbi:amphi-Trp domain-containing protein [Blastococcus sp. URHD0036]|uniref:amphi-Trp domain-containing protein n=1 Tax=Blastococcus sp. URHD0036 TaxID=1380356 RepID=UPI00068C81A0|nr:amphi-Trp domain-containing protein [Blastococcus sp. URHD0036]
MSDVKVKQKQSLSRQEVARLLVELAEGLSGDGKVTVQLGNSTLELKVAEQLRCELEVVVDGDEIELELELKWSTSGRAAESAADEAAGDDHEVVADAVDVAPVDEAADHGLETDAAQTDAPADGEPQPGVPDESATGEDDTTLDASPEVEPGGEEEPAETAAGSAADVAPQPVAAEEPAKPARSRRRAPARAAKPEFNGVDTAAVRAWAAANGMTVSPRGRIKDEVIQAYREAGN